ncbi:hypothetical protein VTO73DRAFT_7746 [Trametes versicolor]
MDAQHGLLSLNDDVLLYAFSFLYGTEACGIALTSKRLHALANRRLAASAICSHPFTFLPLCKHLLQGPQPRARYLEVLDLRIDGIDTVYDAEEVPYGRLLADPLAAAQNIRELILSCRPETLDPRSRIGCTLVTMRNLVDLRIRNVDDDALALLPMLSGSLRRLALWYSSTVPQSTSSQNALLGALTKHPRLESLELRYFSPQRPFVGVSSADHPQFTSLRCLSITEGSVAATSLIDLFPHLALIAVHVSHHPNAPLPMGMVAAWRWPPLKVLYMDESFAILAQHRISQVEKIVIMNEMRPSDVLLLRDPLDAMLRAASPVQVSRFVSVEPGAMHALARNLAALPRLHTLELCLQRKDWEQRYIPDPEEQWLIDSVAPLGHLKLKSLRLIVYVDLALFDSPTPIELSGREQPIAAAAAVPLHVKLTRAIPTLHLFGVVSEYWTTNTKPLEKCVSADRTEAANPWYVAPWLRPMTRCGYYRRWWCRSAGDGADLAELSEDEAKKMHVERAFA